MKQPLTLGRRRAQASMIKLVLVVYASPLFNEFSLTEALLVRHGPGLVRFLMFRIYLGEQDRGKSDPWLAAGRPMYTTSLFSWKEFQQLKPFSFSREGRCFEIDILQSGWPGGLPERTRRFLSCQLPMPCTRKWFPLSFLLERAAHNATP